MRTAPIATAAVLILCGLHITACNDAAKRDEAPGAATATAAPSAKTGGTADRDMQISATIHNHLEVDKDISSTGKMISITTTNGIVVLDGVLHNEGDHQKLLSIVRKVDGVVRIDDRIIMQ